eukprot:1317611-Pyramimonas_sp.AAC.1
MTVFAWLPTSPDDELPGPQHPSKLEKARGLARRWIKFQNMHFMTPATGQGAVATPRLWKPCVNRGVMSGEDYAIMPS